MARMLWGAAFAAGAWSAFAGGNAVEDAKARLPASAAPERPLVRATERPLVRATESGGSGVPGTVVFHGADGMVIRSTVAGPAVAPAYGAGAPARPPAPAQARSATAANPQATVGGGFTPEE